AGYPKKSSSGYHIKRFTTREDAKGWLVEMATLDKGDYDIDGGQQLLEKWLAKWIELQETDLELGLKARTIDDYQNKLGYISSLLGKMRLVDIKPDHTD